MFGKTRSTFSHKIALITFELKVIVLNNCFIDNKLIITSKYVNFVTAKVLKRLVRD